MSDKQEIQAKIDQLELELSLLKESIKDSDEDEEEEEDEEEDEDEVSFFGKGFNLKEVVQNKNLNLKVRDDNSLGKNLDFSTIKTKSYSPDESDLAKINNLSLVPLTQDEVKVFSFLGADFKQDRGFEHFTKGALEKMSKLAVKNKIPFLIGNSHDHEWAIQSVKGVVFDSYVNEQGLIYKVYIPVISKTKEVLEAIMTGLYNKLSVGFAINPEDYVCDSCQKSMFYSDCPHTPGSVDKNGKTVTVTLNDVVDNFEISGVAVPMQPDAHIRRDSLKKAVEKALTPKPVATINGQTVLSIDNESWINAMKELSKVTISENLPNDKISNDTSTIEDKDLMSVETEIKEEIKEEAEVKSEETPVLEAPEVTETVETKAEVTADEPPAIDSPSQNPENPKLMELTGKVDSIIDLLQKSQETISKHNDAITALAEKVTQLQNSVDEAKIGNFEQAKVLVQEKAIEEDKAHKSFMDSYLSGAFLSKEDNQ